MTCPTLQNHIFVLGFIPRIVQPMLSPLHLTALYCHARSLLFWRLASQRWCIPTCCTAHTPPAWALWSLALSLECEEMSTSEKKVSSLPKAWSRKGPCHLCCFPPDFDSRIRRGETFQSDTELVGTLTGNTVRKAKRNTPVRVRPIEFYLLFLYSSYS